MNRLKRTWLVEVRSRQQKAAKPLGDSMTALQEKLKSMMKGVPKADWNTPENSATWQKMYREMRDSPAYKEAMAAIGKLEKEQQKFVEQGEAGSNGPDVAHGYAWLYRRK